MAIENTYDDETLALADAMWADAQRAVDDPSLLEADGRGRSFATLIHRTSKRDSRAEEYREDGEKLRWGFLLLVLSVAALVSLVAVDRSIAARDGALREISAGKR